MKDVQEDNSPLKKHKDIVDISFEIGLLIKAFDGMLEVVGGFLMMLLSPDRLIMFTTFLTHRKLAEDPDNYIANLIMHMSYQFSTDSQYFFVFYFLSHGIIKLILIALLWRKKLWAYPLTIVSLILFIIYQTYKTLTRPSVFIILLTIFDIIMIVLTYIEYKRMKVRFKSAEAAAK